MENRTVEQEGYYWHFQKWPGTLGKNVWLGAVSVGHWHSCKTNKSSKVKNQTTKVNWFKVGLNVNILHLYSKILNSSRNLWPLKYFFPKLSRSIWFIKPEICSEQNAECMKYSKNFSLLTNKSSEYRKHALNIKHWQIKRI